MNNVKRELGKGVCSVALALAIFAMPGSSVAVQAATPYVSESGEMWNVQAAEGDSSITFSWEWDSEFLANGYDPSDVLAYAYMVGHEYTGAEAYMIYTTVDINGPVTETGVMGENIWIEAVPTNVNSWTCDNLTNGSTYYFSCYLDENDWIYPGLTPRVVEVNNSEDKDPIQNNSAQNGINTEVPVVNESVTDEIVVEEAGPSAYELYIDSFIDEVVEAKAGTTVKIDGGKDMTALPNSIMQALYQKGNVSLEFSFEYEEKEYTIVIPAGKAVDADIPWYGHQYLLNNYGK